MNCNEPLPWMNRSQPYRKEKGYTRVLASTSPHVLPARSGLLPSLSKVGCDTILFSSSSHVHLLGRHDFEEGDSPSIRSRTSVGIRYDSEMSCSGKVFIEWSSTWICRYLLNLEQDYHCQITCPMRWMIANLKESRSPSSRNPNDIIEEGHE